VPFEALAKIVYIHCRHTQPERLCLLVHSQRRARPDPPGRDAGRIADEVVSHLTGLMGSTVKVRWEIEAEIPGGAPDQVVRTVTENCPTLKFTSQGFEIE
jgi:hypothetical protein